MSKAKFDALVINLATSTERYSNVCKSFPDYVSINRINAVPGASIPKCTLPRLTSNNVTISDKSPGSLGCLLSHVTALETMLRHKMSHCLILEDDARPTGNFNPHHLVDILPTEYDLCFVNARMMPMEDDGKVVNELRIVGVDETIPKLSVNLTAPGGDGYIVSAKGAELLLHCFEHDGFASFVDWRILAYCTSREICSQLNSSTTLGAALQALHNYHKSSIQINGFIANPCHVEHALGRSDIADEKIF